MDYGLADGEFFDRFERRGSGIAGMDDERKAEFLSERYLVGEGRSLVGEFALFRFGVFGKAVEIPSRFSDGDHAFAL